MLCPKCGAQLSDSAVICRACGAMLPEQPVAPKAPYPPASQPAEPTASAQPAAPHTCTKCGAPLDDGVRFCTNCGAPVPERPDPAQSAPPRQDTAASFIPGVCPHCGSRLNPGARFCTVCGTRVPEAPQGQTDWYASAPGGGVSSPEIGPKHKPKKLLIGLLCGFAALVVIVAVLAGIFAALCGSISPLNGFNLPEAEELVLRASDRGLKISGLFVSGILIASLGAVMDVAMSISSACWELRELNPDLPRKALFRSGMNIGQDAMGTMANTLILAFAGSSLNTLLLFQIFDYPMIQIFNADSIAIEIIRGVAGTIGIILTVPLVALLSAEIMGPKKKA